MIEEKLHKKLDWMNVKHIAVDVIIQDIISICKQEIEESKKDIAEKILKARDSFVEKDYDEVWHWLYSIASPNYDKIEPWEELEKIAGRIKQPESPEVK